MTDGSSDDPKNEATTVAGAEPEKAASSASADTDAEAQASQPAAESEGEPETTAEADTEPASAVEPDAAAEAEDEAAAASDAGSDAEKAGAGAPDDEPEAEADETPADTPDPEPEPEPEADRSRTQILRVPPATAPEDEAEPGTETADEPAAEAEDTSEAAPDTEPEAVDPRRQLLGAPRTTAREDEPGAKTADEADADAKAEEAPADAPDPEPEAEPEAEADHSRTQILRVPRTSAPDDKPEAAESRADASDAPVSKPEPRPGADDSRTQVLRVPGTTAPDRKAEDKPERRPGADDSRTQVLRVPGTAAPDRKAEDKPEPQPEAPGKKAAESAPKVPSWAAAREEDTDPDPERTSRFVALKDLDAAPPVTARPQPQNRPQPYPRPQAPAQVAAPQPLPPLDLLADLTNTPPPPETPRRTVLRRVKVWTPILLLLVGACIGGQMLRPLPDPRLVAAETEHTVDGQLSIPWPARGQGAVRVVGSGDIGTFGDQRPVPTASVAKIMTAYVILKGHPLRKTEPGPDITVDAKTVADGNSASESRITGLTVGSKFSQQDMLKMLMIPSGNNVARLLARWDAGSDSEAPFVEKMNAAARELGMTDTVYTDPSGLDAGTVSTATDQLKLAEAVMKDETFRAIVALPEAPIKGLGEKLTNNNDLLTVQGLSIRGIKTGSSTPAGGTFVWAAYKSVGDETPLIIGSLMEQRAPAPDKDALNSLALVKANSKKIIEAVRAALASTPIVRKGDVVGYVDDGLGGRTPLVAVKDLNAISVPGQQFKLSLKPGASPLPHTAKDGTEVGVLTAGEGEGAKSVPVAVKGTLVEPSFGTRVTRLG
ncbi:D-alanyl-D-alanine carboxypeptidase [Streptomyces erythrochromogenes]|uniref:D-alanyl-D-alanine carboxypeptidase n=1 Tax=Streptomyces erythrochromogenes TaxID=285574 RepID=UPI0036BEBE89